MCVMVICVCYIHILSTQNRYVSLVLVTSSLSSTNTLSKKNEEKSVTTFRLKCT